MLKLNSVLLSLSVVLVHFFCPSWNATIPQQDLCATNIPTELNSEKEIAKITSNGFDLASTITLASGEDDRVYPGETVSFDITVYNQGTITAENIEITLMIPSGLSSVAGIANLGTITFVGPLAAGASEVQTLDFTVDSNLTNSSELIIREEISSAEDTTGANPTDMDSTPDADFTNDPGGIVDSPTDDTINNENGDEDDSDPENVFVEIFDLALRLSLANGEDDRVYPGETIKFDVEVFNQGTVSAEDIVIQDYVPAGLSIIGSNIHTITGPLAPGASYTFIFEFTVDAASNSASIVNRAEITSYIDDLGNQAPDIDSTADTDPANDVTVNDTIENIGGDEDDSDVEEIDVEIFDLASNITLAPGEDDRVYPGETVSFKVTLFNQGTVTAEDMKVNLMIPAGLTSQTGIPNLGTISFAGPLAPGSMLMQTLDFTVDPGATTATELIVKEEISDYIDEFGDMPADIDSTPDADFANDIGGVVDSNTDDTVNNEHGDEDDSDPENVFLEIFDLALTKTTTNINPLSPGDDLTFTITIFNQGTVWAESVEVVDYLPNFFTLSNADTNGWTSNGSTLNKTIFGPIFPGTSSSIDVVLTVQSGIAAGPAVNAAEIVNAMDDFGKNTDDLDSTPDMDSTNDIVVDNEINNLSNDEDDHDIETVDVEICPSDIVENTTYPNGTILVLESSTFISSTSIVEPGADVIYDGANCVELLSGFETQNSSVFEIVIEGCGGAVTLKQEAEEN